MGLDSYLGKRVLKENGEHDWLTFADLGLEGPDVNLCGGMFSGYGADGSFRGKVYADIVEDLTGESLYDDNLDIPAVAIGLRLYCDQTADEKGDKIVDTEWDICLAEVRDLATLFEFAVEHKLDYSAWY